MNKPVLHLFFLIFSTISFGQVNLVPNGSFEEYSACPEGNELNDGQFERAMGWFRPTKSTPDYFNRCNTNYVSVPSNFWGYQEPFDGDGYAGFVPIEQDVNGNYTANEYFRIELLEPLKPCYRYQFSMYVSLADKSTHGIKKIGAYFSQENDYSPIWTNLSYAPQVTYDGPPIIDTLNWTKVDGTFIADGFERYLTIGYFSDNMNAVSSLVQFSGFG